jgi:hypothetical protein
VADKEGPDNGIPWSLVLGLLGASVGVTFVLYVVGAIVEARRFDALKLPGAQTITAVSRDSLVAVGGRALAARFIAAVFASILFYALVRLSQWKGVVPVVLLLIAVLAVALVAGATGIGTWENAAFVSVIGAVAALGWRLVRGKPNPDDARHVVAIGSAVAGIVAAVVLVHIWRPPVDLEYARVELRDGPPESGVYLTLTSDDLYLAPAAACHGSFYTHRIVVVVPRTKILQITLSRKTHVWDGGSDATPAC